MARYLLERNLVQMLHIVPAFLSPYKTRTSASALQRLTMTRLAFLDLPGVVVDNREITCAEPSYTVDTLEGLAREFPDDQLLLVIGADNVSGLSGWKNPQRIGVLATVAVLARSSEEDTGHLSPSSVPPGLRIQYHEDFDQPVSSTRIRAILGEAGGNQESLFEFLPPAVASYILRNQLYRD